MVKRIAVVSAKGGVGKTTVTANLATALALQGAAPVAAFDLDPQNALGLHFGVPPAEVNGLSRSTLGQQPLEQAWFDSRVGVRVVPYGVVDEDDRGRFEELLDAQPDWLSQQIDALQAPAGTFVFIDTPPGPSAYMRQALRAADYVVVVLLADAASYASLDLMRRLVQAHAGQRPGFLGCGYIVNQYNGARRLAVDLLTIMRDSLGEELLDVIHEDAAVAEALAFDQSVLEYDAMGRASHDFKTCAQRIAARLAVPAASPA